MTLSRIWAGRSSLIGVEMSLYLCVFDASGEEVEGIDVGSYADFNFFRDAVAAAVENGEFGSVCPILNTHSDCDGEWTVVEAAGLLLELDRIEREFSRYSAVDFNSDWKREISKNRGRQPETLLDCFFDIDGEPLVGRLRELASASISVGCPILFQ